MSSPTRTEKILFSIILVLALTLVGVLPFVFRDADEHLSRLKNEPAAPASAQASSQTINTSSTNRTHSTTPKWFYGPATARWTITEYADLECPFCKTYTPWLKQWVSQQADVNLLWHHFPLQMHGTAAFEEARLVQCAGKLGGAAAFWQAIDQVLRDNHDNDQTQTELRIAGLEKDELEQCARLDTGITLLVDRQRLEAQKRGVTGTPTVEITDTHSGRSIRLEGPVDGTTLLSAMDWLSTSEIDDEKTVHPGPSPDPVH